MSFIKGHYVPTCYLRRFTNGGGSTDKLFVFDRGRGKWPSSPKKAGCEVGMYAVAGHPTPDLFETSMGEDLESRWGPMLLEISQSRMLPTGEEWSGFLGFVAIAILRSPRFKNWQAQLDAATPPYIPTPPESYVYDMVTNVKPMMKALRLRTWTVLASPPEAPDFICSDNPVNIAPTKSGVDMRGFVPLYQPDTIITVPIDRRTAVAGLFEAVVVRTNRTTVASINYATGNYARQVYAATPDFEWLTPDQKYATADEWLAHYGKRD